MQALTPQLLVDGFVYGEGPRWHEGQLWFSDVQDRAIKTVNDAGVLATALEIDHPSGLGWLPNGDLVVSALGAATITRVGHRGPEIIHDFK